MKHSSLLVAAFVLCSCGSAAVAHPSPTPAPRERTKTAQGVVEDAAVAYAKTHTVRIHGRFVSSANGSGTFTDDLVQGDNGGEHLTVTTAGATVEMITTAGGARYLKADRAWLAKAGTPATVASELSGRWFRFDHTRLEVYLEADGGLETLPSCVEGALNGTLHRDGTATVNGTTAIVISSKGDEPGAADSREYFAATGPLLPLRFELLGSIDKSSTPCGGALAPESHTLTSASFDFSDYNVALTITAPPGALDLRSALGG